MPQFPWLDPAPFFFPAGRVGCLLIHGFSGAPAEMRPMGEYLAQRDITVNGVRLAGHGTTVEDMAKTTWQDWYASVETGYQDLTRRCDRVFVGGFSLGALLAVHLAAQHADVAGLILMSPALELKDPRARLIPLVRILFRYITKDPDPKHSDLKDPQAYKRFWSYDAYPTASMQQLLSLQRIVRTELRCVHCPTLVIYSTGDAAIGPRAGPKLCNSVASAQKEMLVLYNSGHGIVLDSECQVVFEEAYRWITTH